MYIKDPFLLKSQNLRAQSNFGIPSPAMVYVQMKHCQTGRKALYNQSINQLITYVQLNKFHYKSFRLPKP